MRRRASRSRELSSTELKESGEEFWLAKRSTAANSAKRSTAASRAEYWPPATTRENLEVPENELRGSVDSNNYWVPSDNQSNYDKMG